MKRSRSTLLGTVLLTVAALVLLAPRPVSALQGGSFFTNGVIVTANTTANRVWITIYDAAKTRHLDYGWLGGTPNESYPKYEGWDNCCYAAGSIYFVRAEVKKAGTTDTIYDTTIRVVPKLCHAQIPKTGGGSDPAIFGYARVVLKQGKDNYYWDRDDRGDCSFE